MAETCKHVTLQVQLALKSKGLRDDITVLVIDALPSEELRTPPALQRRNRQPIISRCAIPLLLCPNYCLPFNVTAQHLYESRRQMHWCLGLVMGK